VETYLQQYPDLAADIEAALDLIGNELLLRQELGEPPPLAEYLKRFPQWAADIQILFEVERAIDADTLAPPTQKAEAGALTLPAQPPMVLADRAVPGYEILGVLGRGGMAVVYQARQLGLNRLVALKMILAGDAADAAEHARFRHEAEAVAQLQHPNIVQIYDLGEHAGQPYLALEYVPGGTLAHQLGNPQPPHQAAQLVETLARAIHHAHERGIVHRDLKPANILLDRRTGCQPVQAHTSPKRQRGEGPLPCASGLCAPGQAGSLSYDPKITDFGLVKRLEGGAGLTRTGDIVGTPAYMAPEQATGRSREVGPAADVYALGAILYEMLTGQPPFQGETTLETLQRVVTVEPVAPSRLQPAVPRDLETICLKCLGKEPLQRYPSALVLAEDLQRFRTGQPILARPPGRAAGLWRRLRQHPLVTTLAAALLIAVVGVLLARGFSRPVAPRPNGPLIFKDDFDGPSADARPLFGPGTMTFVRQNGIGRLTGTHAGILPVVYEHRMTDFFVDFTIRIPSDHPDAGFGVLFRALREQNGLPSYHALWFFPQKNIVKLHYFHNPQWPLRDEYPCKIDLDRDVAVRLEVVGKQCRVFVNQVFQCEVAVWPVEGLFCLALSSPDGQTRTLMVQKLRVYQPAANADTAREEFR
jgi:serine/threonine protein kinase